MEALLEEEEVRVIYKKEISQGSLEREHEAPQNIEARWKEQEVVSWRTTEIVVPHKVYRKREQWCDTDCVVEMERRNNFRIKALLSHKEVVYIQYAYVFSQAISQEILGFDLSPLIR